MPGFCSDPLVYTQKIATTMRTQFTDSQSSFNGYLFNDITILIIGNLNIYQRGTFAIIYRKRSTNIRHPLIRSPLMICCMPSFSIYDSWLWIWRILKLWKIMSIICKCRELYDACPKFPHWVASSFAVRWHVYASGRRREMSICACHLLSLVSTASVMCIEWQCALTVHWRRTDWSDWAMDGWSTPSHLLVHIGEVYQQISKASLWAIVCSIEGVAGTRRYCAFPIRTVFVK